jgi:membrane protease YdiL (CAAX protease family)
MASEWLLFRAVSAGIGRTGMGWRDLMGAPAFAWKGWLPDVAIAAAIVAAWIAPLLLRRASSASGPGAAAAMLPRGGFEIALWIGLSASAGICEEFTFRGYFQRQFAALTRRPWLGLGLQAVLFGVAHSYEGISSTAAITVYGAVLGGVAAWRGNLRAAIMAHVFTDLAMGVFFG